MIPPPPRSTLFPYTTLFRSGYDLYFHPAPIFSEDNFFGNRTNHWAPAEIKSWMIVGLPSERELDRKSTRLNSSHSSISYAVFCLKKKTKLHRQYIYTSNQTI